MPEQLSPLATNQTIKHINQLPIGECIYNNSREISLTSLVIWTTCYNISNLRNPFISNLIFPFYCFVAILREKYEIVIFSGHVLWY